MKHRILHTEASKGLGGQEVRILRESEGMRMRGHEVVLAVAEGGRLVQKAREAGFIVYELPLEQKRNALQATRGIRRIIKQHNIEIVNTHSSWDAWIGGLAARTKGCKVVRTRHLSTPTRPGLNSHLLFKTLADAVVTTCEEAARTIRSQAHLQIPRCRSIPTGVNPEALQVSQQEIADFRRQYHLKESDVVVGTVCVLRFWKGITEMLQAAKWLSDRPNLKWLIVGDGPSRAVFEQQVAHHGIQDRVIFTGHLDKPQVAIATMDIFLLLSTAHEGVSQASLQAAFLERPLITTAIGGLKEVCQPGITGFVVAPHDPQAVADYVHKLAEDRKLRQQLGAHGRSLVVERFTLDHTLVGMEEVYAMVKGKYTQTT